MQSNAALFNTQESNNLNIKNIKPQNKKKKKTREKKYWTEREEKTLFVLQMALGTKFSIIKTFLKGKDVNDIKNHFYSKLRTYLTIQITNLKSENFFKNIDERSYDTRKLLSLVLFNKIPTMILNESIIKELILNEEQKKKSKKNDLNSSKGKKNNVKLNLKRKRGRPRTKKDENDKIFTLRENSEKMNENNFNFNEIDEVCRNKDNQDIGNSLENHIQKNTKKIFKININNNTYELDKINKILNDTENNANKKSS